MVPPLFFPPKISKMALYTSRLTNVVKQTNNSTPSNYPRQYFYSALQTG